VNDLAARRLPENAEFVASVLDGLGRCPKGLASKWLYDDEGSRLFDRICELEEYYPTRTETAILRANAGRLASLVPPGTALVELGSGSSEKTRILLDAVDAFTAYIPVDISERHLRAAATRLAARHPELAVLPVAADFTQGVPLPPGLAETPKLLFFPGSTLGNFEPDEAAALLRRLRAMPAVVGFVVGADLEKDVGRLVAAYDDREGVTAAFNLNLLHRLNRELDGDFDPAAFAHEARWNAERKRIEMHLVSRRDQVCHVAGRRFAFEEGESIHTENSHKFTLGGFAALAWRAGWEVRESWTDDEALFSVQVLTPAGG
jgi:dimethylhistidine N-methyltransferase